MNSSEDTEDPREWERRSDESARAYGAFSIYRDLREDRSQDRAWAVHCLQRGKDSKSVRRPGLWSKWAHTYDWDDRAEAYDRWIDKEAREAKAQEHQESREVCSKFRAGYYKKLIKQDEDMGELADKMYKVPLNKVTQIKTDEVTRTKTITEMGRLNVGGFAKFLSVKNQNAQMIIAGVDLEEPQEEERKVDRVVWVKAPKPRVPADAIPDKPDKPDKPDSGNTQPITGSTPVPAELFDPLPRPYDEEEAA